ncbi:MAG: IPT/TIG domain-containing protein [Chitinophagaceae bacterium]
MKNEIYLPDIILFQASASLVKNKESFSLYWQVENAGSLEILKNGMPFKMLSAQETSIDVNEAYDGKERQIKYTLIAVNESGKVESLPVFVRLTNKVEVDERLPEIVMFESTASVISNRETFTFNWEVLNADQIEIQRNGISFKKPDASTNTVTISESYDGRDREIEYVLVASNGYARSRSLPVNVKLTNFTKQPSSAPEILYFVSDNSVASGNAGFNLSWSVKNASELIIYKDGQEYSRPERDQDSLSINNPFEAGTTNVEFKLVAFNGKTNAESDIVKITVAESLVSEPPVKEEETPIYGDMKTRQDRYLENKNDKLTRIRFILLCLLAIVIAAVAGLFFYFQSRPKLVDVDPKTVTEERTIVIVGKNLPTDSSRIKVFFNNIPGSVQYNSEEILRVNVPAVGDQLGDGKIRVAVVIDGDTLKAPLNITVTKSVILQPVPDPVNEITQLTDSSLPTVNFPRKKTRLPPRKVTPVDTSPEEQEVTLLPPRPEPKKTIDINKMVNVSSSDFKRRTFGGVKDLELTVQNNSPYDLDNVNVEIKYLKKNEKNIKKANIIFPNVRAHMSMTKEVPNSNRGAKINFSIMSIKSSQLERDLQK